MKKMMSKRMMLAAAVIAVLGAGTAMASGKIAFLASGHSVNDIDYHTAAEVRNSEQLGGKAKAVDSFSDGTAFENGYYMDVDAFDEERNKLGSYPEIMVHYGDGLTLSISQPMTGLGPGPEETVLTGSFEDVAVEVQTIDYLFLPPDGEPSEEDKKLEEEGKLYISYGSSAEERKTWMGALWQENGLSYNLFTSEGGTEAEELLQKAGEIICSE